MRNASLTGILPKGLHGFHERVARAAAAEGRQRSIMLRDRELPVRDPPDRTVRPAENTPRRYRRLARWTIVTDGSSVVAAILLTRLIRDGLDHIGTGFTMASILAPLAWLGLLGAFQLYSISSLSPVEEFRRLVEATITALAIGFLLPIAQRHTAPTTGLWQAITVGEVLLFLLISRKLWHRYRWRLHARGELLFRTLVVGINDEAIKVGDALQSRSSGFLPIGMIETGGLGSRSVTSLPVLGSIIDLSDVIEAHDVECVFVASSAVGPELMKRVATQLRRQNVEIRISANLTQILSSRLSVQPVGELLSLSLKPVRLSGPQAAAKRAFDLFGATFVLVLGSPLWLILAALVKFTSRGPILYRQVRVGQSELPFTAYKFRTMVHGAESMLAELLQRNEASRPLFKIKDDPRITAVGRWLRRFSLDEIPQLLNVVKGDMSLVGPRPALPSEMRDYEDWHHDRFEVPPGMTGLWQVSGRSELGFDDYVRLDLFYIENWSITYDLFILAKTIPTVISRTGAY
jgi:exopolysaccharide biosynthesis polyprenyl glycosylphosphotransferase